jgi:hypothetical protein
VITDKFLGIALAVVTVIALGSIGRCAFLANTVDRLEAQTATAALVNESQTATIQQLAKEKNELAGRIAADTAAAEAAASRYLFLEAEYNQLLAEHEGERDEMGRGDLETGNWLASGMDSRIACSLWPGPACKK